MANVAVLGSTGSIGKNTLEVVRASGGDLRVFAISGHKNTALLAEQARQFEPRYVVITDEDAPLPSGLSELPCEVLCGAGGLRHVVTRPEVDVVMAAIVGSAGLTSTWAAVEAGKRVALANKETLVVAGQLMTRLARQSGAEIIPVDSEHSAVFQTIQAGRRDEVKRIILTASGGPFLRYTKAELAGVTVGEALAHPTWDMGPKITVDSATMMNKALEIIEARWLFDLSADQISVVIHPQSIVHSMVEYQDGSVLAQLSPPDMKLPIQYALYYPRRGNSVGVGMDWGQMYDLHFEPPDFDRFGAIALGLEVATRGGTAGAVLNAANEAAVARFLSGELEFNEIVPACRRALDEHTFDADPTLKQLLELDRWTRQEVARWVYS